MRQAVHSKAVHLRLKSFEDFFVGWMDTLAVFDFFPKLKNVFHNFACSPDPNTTIKTTNLRNNRNIASIAVVRPT